LDLAQQYGFRVAGQEFSTELSRFTAERLGIQVWSDPITEIPVNEKFDPMRDEATAYEPVTEEAKDHMIIEVVQKGYSLNGKVLKAPKVKVGEFKK
jgi:hypothetical protein